MIYIAHRGLFNGTNPNTENSPMQIAEALANGFEVEVDIRYLQGKFYLGHDSAQYEVQSNFVLNTRIWFHAKSIQTLEVLLHNGCSKLFFHDSDEATIAVDTGNQARWIWTYPGKKLTKRSIAVMPERANYTQEELAGCAGICSDYVAEYKRDLSWKPVPIKEEPAPIKTEETECNQE